MPGHIFNAATGYDNPNRKIAVAFTDGIVNNFLIKSRVAKVLLKDT